MKMLKMILATLFALGIFSMPSAQAQSPYRGGSFERPDIPWRGKNPPSWRYRAQPSHPTPRYSGDIHQRPTYVVRERGRPMRVGRPVHFGRPVFVGRPVAHGYPGGMMSSSSMRGMSTRSSSAMQMREMRMRMMRQVVRRSASVITASDRRWGPWRW